MDVIVEKKENKLIIKHPDINKNGIIVGYFIYKFRIVQIGKKKYLERINHHYEDTENEHYYVYGNGQYRSDYHYFYGSPDWETIEKIAKEYIDTPFQKATITK